jgi:ribosomal protein S18 acetylase RimI-like enzyme
MDSPVRLNRKELKRAINIATDAFMDYPLPGGFVSDRNKRRITLYEMFKIDFRYSLRHGEIYTLGGDFQEVAVFHSSAKPVSDLKMIPYLSFSSLRLLTSISIREFSRLKTAVNEIMKAKAELDLPPDTAELYILAVNPINQGEGRAARLIRGVLSVLKSCGKSCLVLTNNEKNKAIYEKLGFGIIREIYNPTYELKTYFQLMKA